MIDCLSFLQWPITFTSPLTTNHIIVVAQKSVNLQFFFFFISIQIKVDFLFFKYVSKHIYFRLDIPLKFFQAYKEIYIYIYIYICVCV